MVVAATLSGGAGGRAGGRVSTQAATARPSSADTASTRPRRRRSGSGGGDPLRRALADPCGDPGLGNGGTATILPHTAGARGQGVDGVDCDAGDAGAGGGAAARAVVAVPCLWTRSSLPSLSRATAKRAHAFTR